MRGYFANYTSAENYARIVDYPNVTAMWKHSVETFADNVAIIDTDPYTYAQLDQLVSGFRTVLKNAKAVPGSVVGILCPNSVGFVKAFLAAATFATPAVLMPPHLDPAVICGIAQKFGMKALVYDESLAAKVEGLEEKVPGLTLVPASATSQEATPAVDALRNPLCIPVHRWYHRQEQGCASEPACGDGRYQERLLWHRQCV